jgi:hypothetical protein
MAPSTDRQELLTALSGASIGRTSPAERRSRGRFQLNVAKNFCHSDDFRGWPSSAPGHNYVCVTGKALIRAASIDAEAGGCPATCSYRKDDRRRGGRTAISLVRGDRVSVARLGRPFGGPLSRKGGRFSPRTTRPGARRFLNLRRGAST